MTRLVPVLAVLLGCAGRAPVPDDGPPEPPLPLPDGVARLEDTLAPILADHAAPALGAAIVEGDRLVAIGAVGVRARGTERAVTVHDRWHVGSITKSMTATLIARQVAAGALSLDRSVTELLPEVDAHPGWAGIPLGDVLRQRTGIRDIGLAELVGWRATDRPPAESRRRWVAKALAAPPKPGAFAYANGNYVLAGAILERHAGRPWEELVADALFGPLGMTRSGLGAPSGLHQPWGHRSGWLGLSPVPPGAAADNPPPLGPAGTVHASLHDLARYAAAHLAIERGEPPWDAPVFRWLHTPPEGGDYAGGWVVEARDGGRVLRHNGSNTMWYAIVSLDPARDRAVVVTANAFDQEGVHAALEALEARP